MVISKTGNKKIDDLLWLYSWTGDSGKAVTVTYNPDLSNWAKTSLDGIDARGVKPAAFTNTSLLDEGLPAWSNVAKITFQSTTSLTPNFAVSLADSLEVKDTKNNTWVSKNAFVSYPPISNGILRDVDMLVDKDILNDTAKGSYGYYTIVHEIGHILGLRDVFDNQYSKDTSILSYAFSVENPHTPMIYDIAAAQYLYGANMSYNSGPTTYDKKYITGEKRLWTIWDGGGEDTIDVSELAIAADKIQIDLRGGVDENGKARLSKIGDEYIAIALDPSPESKWEKPIEIEHAKGTKNVKNFVIGNAANNTLIGGDRFDTIIGGDGIDELRGEKDKDILVADNSYAKRRFGIDFSDNTDITYNPEKQNISSLYGGLSCIKQKIMQSSQICN